MHSLYANASFGIVPWFVGFSVLGIAIVAVLVILIVVLKGYALWHAAKRDEKGWFIALLLLNTAGILELIYLYFIVKKWDKPTSSSTPASEPQS